MGQEFIIKSTALEDKINQLLPSQGGAGAGVDLSASTTIVPIVDLTESGEGSTLREDLQAALSHDSCTAFSVNNSINQVLINTTGYFRVFGTANCTTTSTNATMNLFDGTTAKNIMQFGGFGTSPVASFFDFIVFLAAGDSLRATCGTSNALLAGVTRQIADISGTLVNP